MAINASNVVKLEVDAEPSKPIFAGERTAATSNLLPYSPI
jgi:hypothetical protein